MIMASILYGLCRGGTHAPPRDHPCLLLTAGTAAGQTVPDDNALVFYFDEGASVRSVYGTGSITAYLVAGPMIDFEGNPYAVMNGWGANGMRIDPFENVASAVLTPRGAATPASYTFTGYTANVGFDLGEPLPLAGRTVIAELALEVVSEAPTYLRPCGVNGGSCDVDGVQRWFEILRDDTGLAIVDTSVINGEAPLATDSPSWGGVKALYR